jgi:hypothetical protein
LRALVRRRGRWPQDSSTFVGAAVKFVGRQDTRIFPATSGRGHKTAAAGYRVAATAGRGELVERLRMILPTNHPLPPLPPLLCPGKFPHLMPASKTPILRDEPAIHPSFEALNQEGNRKYIALISTLFHNSRTTNNKRHFQNRRIQFHSCSHLKLRALKSSIPTSITTNPFSTPLSPLTIN